MKVRLEEMGRHIIRVGQEQLSTAGEWRRVEERKARVV